MPPVPHPAESNADRFPPTVTAGPYDEVLRGLITAHKEEQAWHLTGLLARLLAASVAEIAAAAGLDATDPLVLVPVPSSPAAVRRRGSTPPVPWPGARPAD